MHRYWLFHTREHYWVTFLHDNANQGNESGQETANNLHKYIFDRDGAKIIQNEIRSIPLFGIVIWNVITLLGSDFNG